MTNLRCPEEGPSEIHIEIQPEDCHHYKRLDVFP